MKLYHLDRSPFNWKVRIVLAEKGLSYEGIIPENKSEDAAFAKLNPFKLTTVLVTDDGRALFESTVICEYLEEAHPAPALLPKDPWQRARIRLIEDTTDQYLYTAIKSVREPMYDWVPPHLVPKAADQVDHAALEKGRTKVHEHLGWLERELGDGPWFGGKDFSLADAALAPPLAASLTLLGMLPDSKYPRLSAWIARVKERPSYVASSPKVPLTIKK